jgi:hypothetical protein
MHVKKKCRLKRNASYQRNAAIQVSISFRSIATTPIHVFFPCCQCVCGSKGQTPVTQKARKILNNMYIGFNAITDSIDLTVASGVEMDETGVWVSGSKYRTARALC